MEVTSEASSEGMYMQFVTLPEDYQRELSSIKILTVTPSGASAASFFDLIKPRLLRNMEHGEKVFLSESFRVSFSRYFCNSRGHTRFQ